MKNDFVDEKLKKELPFDLYGRHAIAREIIDQNRENGEIFRVLDVGGRGDIFKNFLPKDNVFYLDPFIETTDENFIKGDGCNMPLKDESFDWVVSFDVFEHVPEKERENFLKENIRVAKYGVILVAPFYSKEVAQAEINANENYKIFSGGQDHLWLREHIENGLPRESHLEKYAIDNNIEFQKLHNNRLLLWENLLGVCFLVNSNINDEIRKIFEEFNYFYNTEIYPFDSSESSYRKIYFFKKDRRLKSINKELKSIDDELFLEVIKRALNLIAFVDIKNKNEIATAVGRRDHELQQKEKKIEKKEQEIGKKEEEIRQKENELYEIRTSLRWKIPNYFYKLYKKKIKKFVPRKVFIFVNYVFRKINELGRDLSVDDKLVLKWKSYFLKNKNKKIVLFVDRSIPEYDKDAGSFIAFQYLKILKELNYHVIFWPQDMKNNDFYAKKLNNLGVEIMLDNFSPYFFVKNFGKKIDIAMLSRPSAGNNFVSNFRKYSDAKIVYIGHDLHYLRESRAESVNNEMLKGVSEITKKNEFSIMKNSDISLFFSDKEVSMIKEEDKSIEADVIPWIEDAHKCNRDKLCDRKKIVFLGGFSHLPNADAVKWFHDYIYPKISNKFGNYVVTIVGSNVPDDIKSFAEDKFEIRGYVEEDDLFDIFEDTRVFIAPLRFGAGFKGKIAKAMSCGLPVVTTDIGAEGIGLIDGENAMIANTAELFAEKIENVLVDDDLWLKLSKNSIKHIRDNYSTENGKIKMENLLMK